MNLPGTTIHKLIDNLTRSPFSFALYRLPWTDEPIIGFTGRRRCRSTKQPGSFKTVKEGFVMTPFHQTEEYPAVLIRPDKVAHEWENISQTLEAFASSISFEFSSSFNQKKKEVLMLRKQKKNMNRFSPVSFHH